MKTIWKRLDRCEVSGVTFASGDANLWCAEVVGELKTPEMLICGDLALECLLQLFGRVWFAWSTL